MAKPQARLGDATSHGGTIITGALSVSVDGRPLARMGDLHACPLHGLNPIVSGSPDTLTEGKPNARLGDVTACGAVIISASPTTNDN